MSSVGSRSCRKQMTAALALPLCSGPSMRRDARLGSRHEQMANGGQLRGAQPVPRTPHPLRSAVDAPAPGPSSHSVVGGRRLERGIPSR